MRAVASTRSPAAGRAHERGDDLSPPQTDWLRHDLVVTGPTIAITAFQSAAAGAGAIPWHHPDQHLEEEDRFLALVNPPDGSPGMRVAAARVLARQLRDAMDTHRQRVIALAGRSRACPLDLHALLPVPLGVLSRGPDDPVSIAWLRRHWGVVQALRHVRLRATTLDRRQRRSARLDYAFWSADWSPWAALIALRTHWPTLVFDLRPDYDDG
jgi:hypothetical protein